MRIFGFVRLNRADALLLLLLLILPFNASASSVTDLTITKSGNNVILSWTTGTATFRVLRSTSPAFITGNTLLAEGISSGPFTDVDAAATGKPNYFYQVISIGSGESNPGLYDYNSPRPIPAITGLVPDNGISGDTITINGSNFPDSGQGMVVMFDTLEATVLTVSTTQITVTVPTGAITGDVFVCSFDCSNHLLFKVLLASTTTFSNISSLSFESGTGSDWLGDRGTGDKVYEIDSTGVATNRAGQNEAVVSNPSPTDGTGRIYFSNSLVNTANQGSISYVNSSTNTVTFFRASGTASTDPVYCRGLAVHDSEPNVVYDLDARLKTIRRVPSVGTIDKDFGNVGNGFFNFNDPAGARFDAAGNLYVSTTTTIYKITPAQAVSVVGTGFTGAAGIDLSEATGIVVLMVADKATGKMYLLNTETDEKTEVASGYTNPVATSFTENIANGDLFYDLAEPTKLYRLPDPTVQFTKKQNVKVLMGTYRKDASDTYLDPMQTQDRQIEVEVEVIPPKAETLYFRIVEGSNNKGSAGSLSSTSATTDATSGKATITLTITDQYGGNTYRIQASEKPLASFKKIAESKEYSAWKRAYIEYDKMYKVGQFVNADSGAGTANADWIYVATPSMFSIGDQVHIMSGATSNSTQNKEDGEKPTVTDNTAPDHIVVNGPLNNLYPASGPITPPYSFLAKVAGGFYETKPDPAKFARAYDEAFVDWRIVDASGFMPFYQILPGADDNARTGNLVAVSFRYFKNSDFDGSGPNGIAPFRNHVQLVAAARLDNLTGSAASLGRTSARNVSGTGFNCSWAFMQTAMDESAITNLQNALDDVNAHELGHQWNVNPPEDTTQGHCSENECNGSRKCLMNDAARDKNLAKVARFHCASGDPKDLFCIRGHVDDLNQDDCSWPP